MTRSLAAVAILMLFALAVPPRFVAHPGHDQTVMGTVKSLKENHLGVEDKDGKVTMFMLAETTKILRGKVKAAPADIKVGERVVVIGTTHEGADHSAGTLLAKEVRLAAA